MHHNRMEPPPNGYARMADMVGQYPETAIFSRFARLNAKNLLYMQAELVQMEYELDTVAFEDSQGDDPNRRSFQAYVYNMKKARGPDSLQWRMVLEIRQRLKEYSMFHQAIKLVEHHCSVGLTFIAR